MSGVEPGYVPRLYLLPAPCRHTGRHSVLAVHDHGQCLAVVGLLEGRLPTHQHEKDHTQAPYVYKRKTAFKSGDLENQEHQDEEREANKYFVLKVKIYKTDCKTLTEQRGQSD